MRYNEIINEVEIGGDVEGIFPDDVDQKDLSSDQLDLFQDTPSGEPKLPKRFKFLGKMDGGLYVAEKIENDKRKKNLIFIKGGQAVAFMDLHTWDRDFMDYPQFARNKPELNGKGLQVGAVYVKEEYRGQNLGPKMYLWVLQNICDYIISDFTHTKGGVYLWKKMQNMKAFSVQVWDSNRYISRKRRSGKDFNHVYNTYDLIPWVTLPSKLNFVLNDEAEESLEESQSANVTFYHVTFSSRVPAIMKDGLVAGKRRNWNNHMGAKLGKKAIYLFSDLTMAVRWAARMEWDFKKDISILVVKNPPGEIVADDHIEAQMNGGTWFHTDETIPPECITKVVPLTPEMKRELVKNNKVSLDEAVPSDEMKTRQYYHGVGSMKAAQAIMSEGLKGRENQGKSHLAPVRGRVYLTPHLTYAIIYALGGNFSSIMQEAAGDFKDESNTDPYGYVFVVKGSDMVDVQPDEDSVGEWFHDNAKFPNNDQWSYKGRLAAECKFSYGTPEFEIWNFIKKTMTEKQRLDSLDGYIAAHAAGGKRVLKTMPDWMKIQLINMGAHVAHGGSIQPSECWRILKRDMTKLKKDGSNFFQIAERIR